MPQIINHACVVLLSQTHYPLNWIINCNFYSPYWNMEVGARENCRRSPALAEAAAAATYLLPIWKERAGWLIISTRVGSYNKISEMTKVQFALHIFTSSIMFSVLWMHLLKKTGSQKISLCIDFTSTTRCKPQIRNQKVDLRSGISVYYAVSPAHQLKKLFIRSFACS